jgi:integrase
VQETGKEFNPNNYLFNTQDDKPLDPNLLKRAFKGLLKRLKIDNISFHSLRHTYATRMLEVNIHPKIVQELLGHTSISVTLDTYSSVLPEYKREAAEKINHLFDNNEDKIKG